jgi:UDP-glucose 4-epimerase
VYGPNVPAFAQSVVSTFIEQIKKGQPVTVNGDGSQSRDFVFISDVVDAFSRVIISQTKSNFEVFNICSAKSTSLNELIKVIAGELDKKAVVEHNPSPAETVSWIGDFKNAKKALNWEPSITLEKGIKKCVLA